MDYVKDLQSLMDMLGEDSTSVIFPNIADILTNTAFLFILEERQRELGLYVDRVGNLLETHLPRCESNAGKVLQSLRDTNQELAAQLRCLWENPRPGISTYLVTFWHQCLTRYHLLIRQVLQYSDPPAPTPDLSSALQLTSSLPTAHAERVSIGHKLACAVHILEEVNETIRDQESRAGFGEVSNQLRIGKEQ
ncbi:hypothetical protein F5J12DRAFT_891761 [Pisolithus orientalis]|uniref:uncharacterized protein n=1 Tax=Pisolithus orientalis TaxID=936130 RepID=UPI00222482C2|nr:uncharacterized protein F5J12DRAFT_891735 [Pisolithus orientalis]XP_051601236.1 uncharacterized protein F5J12DRAFT_891761 [Pisolithus orientalis]KAI6009626.1 hypothetical protein F5J12DRAFT_891735 [Pisolithus orientalis]KAI6009641.1 hypothetical protein F5J12DRAFT_891761 [Pisolithus orientalis]